MEGGLYIRVIIDRKHLIPKLIEDWYTWFGIFKFRKMRITDYKGGKLTQYESKVFIEKAVSSHLKNNRSVSQLHSDDNKVAITSGSHQDSIVWLTLSIDESNVFDKFYNLITNLQLFIKRYGCIVAYVHSSFDQFMQDNDDVNHLKMFGGDLSKVHFIEHPIFKGEKAIDTEYNPGHSHICNGIWFGASWLMWFGDKYFDYIPKEAILENTCSYKTTEYPNGIVEVQLYERLEDYDKAENRSIQWRFRKELGIDLIAHQIIENRDALDIDPSYEVIIVGAQRYLVSYLDEKDEITTKSKSTKQIQSAMSFDR